MDLLAIAAADSTVLPLWAAFLFAVGMYPVGMFLGCSSCCCPEQVSVTFSGLTKSSSKVDLTAVVFSSCFGSDAHAVLTSPGGLPETDSGPLDSVTLMNGGSGYAKLGRTAPTLSASVSTSTGSGASFDVTVTKAAAPGECGLHYWEVSKITVVDGGTGYDPSDGVQISLSEGDSADSGAVISVTLAQLPPDLTLGVSSQAGTGAELTPQTDEAWWSTPQARVWQIQSVTVDDGGDGYTHLDTVTVTRGAGTFFADGYYDDATLSLITANTEPTVGASVESTGGTGASLSVTLAETEIYPPPAYSAVPVWAVESIAVDSAGTGYAQFDSISFSVVDGDTRSTAASAYVSEVDANGGIVAVSVYSGGEYFKGGPITAVSVVSGGGYVKRNGEIESVAVTNGGKYYREDASLPPYVAEVTVNVAQNLPSDGSGAVITATVGDDPQNPETFGKITGVSIENGGSGYLAWTYADCPVADFNGKTFTLRRTSAENCEYSACVGDAVVSATYANDSGDPEVSIYPRAGDGCSILFYGDEVNSRTFTASELLGGLAEVSPATPESVFTCETLGSASSVTVEVEAVDWVEKYTASQNGTAVRKATHCWPGSLYAGTYDLDFFGDVTEFVPYGLGGIYRTGRSFRYYYEANDLFCDTPYLELVVFPETVFFTAVVDAVMYVRLKRSTSFTNCRTGALPHKELADMDCVSGGPSNDLDFVGVSDYSVSTVCPCDGGWFATAVVFAGGGCSQPSDEGPVDETIAVAGRRSFRMNVVAFSNE